MKTFRIICFLACLVLIAIHFYNIDYQDLSFKTNRSHYIGIFAMLLVGLSFLIGIIKDRKNKE